MSFHQEIWEAYPSMIGAMINQRPSGRLSHRNARVICQMAMMEKLAINGPTQRSLASDEVDICRKPGADISQTPAAAERSRAHILIKERVAIPKRPARSIGASF